ncbi:MAG TPA: META domain-containing protein [Gemmatimonadaceae bacterium]|nr:META domain-containing protein [Gemmatimonadaceae bacterium]
MFRTRLTLLALAAAINPESLFAQGAETLTLRGTLTYQARVALTPDSRAIVAVQDVSPTAGAGSAAETWIDLKGRQVPIAFELKVPSAKLVPGRTYELRGAIFSEGRPRWVTDRVPITQSSGVVDLGTLTMGAYRGPAAFASTLKCGDREVTIDFIESGMRLTVGNERFPMKKVESASGAKYEAVTDRTTTLWSKGDAALVTLHGKQLPECTSAGARALYRARGNEPGWTLEMDDKTITIVSDYGKSRLSMPRPSTKVTPDGKQYVGKVDGKDVVVTIAQHPCADAMTGMPYPDAVVVQLPDRQLKGCGGDPVSLLQGSEWVVEDIGGGGIIDNSRATINFATDGSIYGRASCNTYRGSYILTGEGLIVSKAAATLMACAPALMEQEQRFLDALQSVQRFEISSTGALVLHGANGKTITARR